MMADEVGNSRRRHTGLGGFDEIATERVAQSQGLDMEVNSVAGEVARGPAPAATLDLSKLPARDCE